MRKHTRYDNPALIIWKIVNRKLDQSQGEVQTCMFLQIRDDILHSLADTVADDQQQKPASTQIVAQSVIEVCLVDVRMTFAHDPQHCSRIVLQSTSDGSLKLRRIEESKLFGIVEYLRDNIAARFCVSPQLAFDENGQPGRRDEEIVDQACGRDKLATDWDGIYEGWINFEDRQAGWVRVHEFLDEAFEDCPFST